MNGLMLHCGGQLATREEVFAVPVPEATATYVPLPYESFVSRIEKQVAVEGMAICEERLAIANDGQRLFGLISLEMKEMPCQEYGCVLGLRTSYDRSFANGLSVGAQVFVCDNLSFSGDITFTRKHTTNMLRDLSWMISEAMSGLPIRFKAQGQIFESYKRQNILDAEAHHLAVRLWDQGVLSAIEISRVIKEWREPRHEAWRNSPNTVWRFFNAVTELIKGDLWRLPARTRITHRVLDEFCGLHTSDEPKLGIPVIAEVSV